MRGSTEGGVIGLPKVEKGRSENKLVLVMSIAGWDQKHIGGVPKNNELGIVR